MVIVSCVGCNQSSLDIRRTESQSILNTTWHWQETVYPVEKITVLNPEQYTILLTDKGGVEAMFDCNRGGGTYQLSEGNLSFGPLMSTRMACPPDTQDVTFIRDLQRVESYFIEDGNLYLELPLEHGTMKFVPAP